MNFNSRAWCVYKSAIFIIEAEKYFYIQMDKMIEMLEFRKKNNIPTTIDIMLDDLKNLRDLK